MKSIKGKSSAIFDRDDVDAASEGNILDDNHVYPNGGNIIPDKDDQFARKIKDLMKYIDRVKRDHFDSSNFCKKNTQFIEKRNTSTGE